MHSDLTLMFACVLTDSLSAQRVHTHGRRVRHSSSDSSGSDRSVESGSSSLHSRNPSQSPEVHPDPLLPANVQPACSSNKEVSARLERSSVSTSFAQVCEFFMGSGGPRAADGRYVCVSGGDRGMQRRVDDCGLGGGRGSWVQMWCQLFQGNKTTQPV